MNLFVITPYQSDPLYEIKKAIVLNLSKANGLDAYYASNYLIDGKLDIDRSIELYKNADFFIADLSYERPSCYFEVGYVQAMNKHVFLIARKSTVIHQVQNKDTIRLYNDLSSYSELITSILKRRI